MNHGPLHPIGELARRTGLSVRTIRFYSDAGIVVPAGRTAHGHRLYGADAVARLDLVRTLRELGLGLPDVRRVVEQEAALPDVAAAHAQAVDVQIRTLRLRRAVLTAAARRGSTPEELDLMHRFAKLSEEERRRMIGEFLDAAFEGLHAHPAFGAVIRSMTPELPDDPSTEQIEAWVELAELLQDAGFRASLHATALDLASDRARDDRPGMPRVLAETVRSLAEPALAAGVDPASAEGAAIASELAGRYARIVACPDGPDLRARLSARLERMNDPRRDRYLRLLAIVNGWAEPEGTEAVLEWTMRAVRPGAA
ncbi:MerR family transcriptional regulator [Streptomyces spiroverticillatus]|uniref:MerR family transcriptional regulator n=1 Tax=Streptomyces finlayi TaxID=67296 RepID=A0A919C9P8_9ACTN|nr:MerR family transcriptional regulator [Streptomyces finlayi]GHA07062.1 MerR family transcriptional regulator [Streptomyces spiroverticillatus]GHC90487.1 MerR family transcriptional regulator [Streptomyces finlayi]